NCRICRRWYDNARQVASSAPLPPPPSSARLLMRIYRLAGAPIDSEIITFAVEPCDEPGRLNRLRARLLFTRKESGPWLCRLLFPSRRGDPDHGNPAQALRRFDGSLVRLSLRLDDDESFRLLTRLDLDAEDNLTTPPEPLGLDNPARVKEVHLRRVRSS